MHDYNTLYGGLYTSIGVPTREGAVAGAPAPPNRAGLNAADREVVEQSLARHQRLSRLHRDLLNTLTAENADHSLEGTAPPHTPEALARSLGEVRRHVLTAWALDEFLRRHTNAPGGTSQAR